MKKNAPIVEISTGLKLWNSCEFEIQSGTMYALQQLNTTIWNA